MTCGRLVEWSVVHLGRPGNPYPPGEEATNSTGLSRVPFTGPKGGLKADQARSTSTGTHSTSQPLATFSVHSFLWFASVSSIGLPKNSPGEPNVSAAIQIWETYIWGKQSTRNRERELARYCAISIVGNPYRERPGTRTSWLTFKQPGLS